MTAPIKEDRVISFFEKNITNRYNTIVIDPPWNQGKTGKRKVRPNQTVTLDYPTMSKEELLNMPIELILLII